jgi:dolichol-phosphate mannosyltransferase
MKEFEIRVSIAAPAYNEAECIREVLASWITYLSSATFVTDFEIVVCDDGSTDGTGDILDAVAEQSTRVRPVHFISNRGAGAALRSAIKATRFEWVMLIDSDGQFPVENLELLKRERDLSSALAVMGVRQKKDGLLERFGTRSSAWVANRIYGSRLKDFNSAMKLVSGPLLREITIEAQGMNYSTEITARLLERGTEIREVNIRHAPRLAGRSKMSLVRGALGRFLFLSYMAYRRKLISLKVLCKP